MSAKLEWATQVKSRNLCELLGLNAVDGQNIGSFSGLDKSWLSRCNMTGIYNSLFIFGLHEATIVSCWTMVWTCTTAVINTQVLPNILPWLIWSNLTKSILHEVRIFKQPESTAAAEAGIALPCMAGAHLLTLSFFPLSQLRAHPHQHTPTRPAHFLFLPILLPFQFRTIVLQVERNQKNFNHPSSWNDSKEFPVWWNLRESGEALVNFFKLLHSNEGNADAQKCKAYLSTQEGEEEGITLSRTGFLPFGLRVDKIRERADCKQLWQLLSS